MRPFRLLLLAAALSTPLAASDSAPTLPDFHQPLSDVRPPELPATAAALVREATDAARSETTAEVLRVASTINPSAMLSVVGAISRSTPAMAPIAAATAAGEQPRLAWAFARTAALAAPDYAGDVVSSTAQVVPSQRLEIATAVARAIPQSGHSVLTALSKVDPALEPYLAEGLWLRHQRTMSAPSIIAYAYKRATEQPPIAIAPDAQVSPPAFNSPASGNKPPKTPPEIGPPFENPPGNPDHTIPGPPFETPPGWMRKYSSPRPPPSVPPGPPNPLPPGKPPKNR